MTIDTTGKTAGDVIIEEAASPIITRESISYTNAGAVDIVIPPGQPFTNAALTASAGIAALTGIACDRYVVGAGKTQKIAVLVRGPAAVNRDALPTHDKAATPVAFDMAAFGTRLTALGIIPRREPPTKTTFV